MDAKLLEYKFITLNPITTLEFLCRIRERDFKMNYRCKCSGPKKGTQSRGHVKIQIYNPHLSYHNFEDLV